MKQSSTFDSKPIILVVEDDIDDIDMFSYVFSFTTDCCKLQFVNDGQKAIDLLSSLPPDKLPVLIVLDYNLPGIKGCDAVKQLSQIDMVKTIPKIIYSTYSDEKYIAYCKKAGAKAYLKKSNTMGGIIQDIDNILNLSHLMM